MLDGLLKPKFHSKCKSYARLTKTRLDTIRKKRNAVQKFLKEDIADLLTSALDYNAYGRVEGLLVEQNMSSCYELIAKYIGCILYHVNDLSKQRDCPDECKEAIPSLMYAAARFSDLPELRDLRTLFTEKFGNSLEPYLSKEFVKRLRQDPPTKEMKIQLLRDLAQEFSILWNSKALEQRLYSPPALHELQGKAKPGPLNDCDDKKRHENNERDTQSQGRKGVMGGASWRLQSSSYDETSIDNSSPDGPKARSSSLGSVSEDEVEVKRPFSNRLVPPPYVKEKLNEAESNLKKTAADSEAVPVKESKPKPRSVRRRPRNPPPGYYDTVSHSKADDTNAKVDSNGMKSERANDEEEEARVMDGLLMHYSKKQSRYESGTGKGYPWKQVECGDEQQNIRRTKSGSGVPPVPVGGTSPPPKDKTTHPMGTLKGRGAASLHVHPSLPDYDDLSARLAALRGT